METTQITLADIVRTGRSALMAQYGTRLQSHHRQALTAIESCRTAACGELHRHCSDCGQAHHHPLSCGHRSCPQCQSHTTAAWFDRQRAKRLPVDYFMVTFTLPAELRSLAAQQPRAAYEALFASRRRGDSLKPARAAGRRGSAKSHRCGLRTLRWPPIQRITTLFP